MYITNLHQRIFNICYDGFLKKKKKTLEGTTLACYCRHIDIFIQMSRQSNIDKQFASFTFTVISQKNSTFNDIH